MGAEYRQNYKSRIDYPLVGGFNPSQMGSYNNGKFTISFFSGRQAQHEMNHWLFDYWGMGNVWYPLGYRDVSEYYPNFRFEEFLNNNFIGVIHPGDYYTVPIEEITPTDCVASHYYVMQTNIIGEAGEDFYGCYFSSLGSYVTENVISIEDSTTILNNCLPANLKEVVNSYCIAEFNVTIEI